MAIQSANTIPAVIYSWQLDDLNFEADTTTINLILQVGVKQWNATYKYIELFNCIFYVYDGSATVYDLASVVENYMQQHGDSAVKCKIIAKDATANEIENDCTIVYCHDVYTEISAEDLLNDNFLTTNFSRLTTPTAEERLNIYLHDPSLGGDNSVGYTLYANYIDDTGDRKSVHKNIGTRFGGGVYELKILSVSKIREEFTLAQSIRIVSYAIKCGNRLCTFYVQRVPEPRMFFFRNKFNVWELAAIPASHTHKVSTDSSLAVCGKQLTQYDIEHTHSFETQTATLLLRQAEWLLQMMTSHDVRLKESDNPLDCPQVLITSYTAELSDEPAKQNTIKFDWRFADKRHSYLLSPTKTTNGVFTEEYTEEFL